MSIRLEPSLIATLRQMAAQLPMPYQTLTRGLIRRGLQLRAVRAARAASP
ncbi:MAG: hypothetical protein AB7Y46_15985 [Armatimonadota bacterium]